MALEPDVIHGVHVEGSEDAPDVTAGIRRSRRNFLHHGPAVKKKINVVSIESSLIQVILLPGPDLIKKILA